MGWNNMVNKQTWHPPPQNSYLPIGLGVDPKFMAYKHNSTSKQKPELPNQAHRVAGKALQLLDNFPMP